MIRNAKGRKFSYDSAAEAFEELHEYGEGATVWTREVYRGMFITRSVDGWQQISPPTD
ncbi:hypothetical protein [Streptomyces sp.]|uniref:hypothetical protein n=1 Tax=Streptomyces sp. TaxID=1931 RepID=UPI002D77B459|nr:hypothetical protein [Streptomyces sp.]HET6360211.1 hypothetical protein [Streptomyces sp.]